MKNITNIKKVLQDYGSVSNQMIDCVSHSFTLKTSS